MRAVSNTSPLCYLILIECEDVLHRLFGGVAVSLEVMAELKHQGAPDRVRNWAEKHGM